MNKNYLNYIRIQEWWGHILPPILIFFYAGLLHPAISKGTLFYALMMLLFLSVMTAVTGYFLNDLFDIRDDQKAGKRNYVAGLPAPVKAGFLPLVFLFIFLVLMINPGQLPGRDLFLYSFIFILNTLLFLLYSSPPIRLKTTPWLAPVMDALYSGTLFYVLAFLLTFNKDSSLRETFSRDPRLCMLIFFIFFWGFLKGLRTYLTHLCNDQKHDELSGIKTLATIYGAEKLQTAANFIFPAELVCLIIFLLLLPGGNLPSLAVCFIFLSYWALHILKTPGEKAAFLNDLHEVWLPLILLGSLVYLNPHLWLLLLLHVILFPYHLYKIYCLADRIYFYTLFQWMGPLRKKH